MVVFLLRRRLRVGDQEVVIPVGLYREAADAQKAGATIQGAQAGMLGCSLVTINSNGEGEDTGAKVGQYLAALGVMGFKIEIVELEVAGAMVEVAASMPKGTPTWQS